MHLSVLPLLAVAASAWDLGAPVPGAVNPEYTKPEYTKLGHRSNRDFKRQNGFNPPADLKVPLKEVWDHVSSTYNGGNLFSFKNYGWDQIMATKGKINYCVRWESDDPVSEELRAQVAKAAAEGWEGWFKHMYGYDGFPFTKVEVNVVGWAVRDRSLLQGSTDGIDVYTDKDAQGVPQCAESCGRFFNQGGSYPNCPGGADRHYDQSLWATKGGDFGGGAGGDWGQRVEMGIFMNELTNSPRTFLQHEMGHTMGLDDFYDWKPTGGLTFIMDTGLDIVDFDVWMLKNFWSELKRNRGW